MLETIKAKLKEIEEKEQVRIIHAVESGSRAWGFASPDSDYDVRFIYIRKPEAYMHLEKTRDVIEWQLDDTLDINGWDLQKALRLLHRSNPTLFEWNESPIVYRTTEAWAKLQPLIRACFMEKSGLYHYLSMAKSNYREYLKSDMVRLKKYFYVLRPVLACRWILEHQSAPPMAFSKLAEACLPKELKPEVDRLLEMKMASSEMEYGPRIDAINRPMRITHMEGDNHVYTGEVTYDAYNNLARFEETVGSDRTAYSTAFSYDVENKPTLLKYNDSDSDKVAYTYDDLGRIEKRTVTVGGNARETSYTYIAGEQGSGSTTGLIASISQTGGNFTYTYNDNGNITKVVQDGVTTEYTYDALGQLIQVDDGQENATWVYEYDQGGNILSKRKYALGVTTGTASESKTFTYGNANWKDQLTAVNGKPITYDNIGNPTQYGADNDADKITYEWEKGRQLKKIVKPGETVEFKYNENGLRIQKVATSTGTTNYTLHGKNIVHMTQGSNNLHFFYDASNRPTIVEFNGTKYAYVHNLQGDIVAILDSAGTAVVQYKYDAWGKPISKTGSMKDSLGKLNPFRYRGYVYDEETGVYYLRSRYYVPCLGRFLNEDCVLQTGSLLGMSQYAYCRNRPIGRKDPSGTEDVSVIGGHGDSCIGSGCDGNTSLTPPDTINPYQFNPTPMSDVNNVDCTLVEWHYLEYTIDDYQAAVLTEQNRMAQFMSTVPDLITKEIALLAIPLDELFTLPKKVNMLKNIAGSFYNVYSSKPDTDESTYVASSTYTTLVAIYKHPNADRYFLWSNTTSDSTYSRLNRTGLRGIGGSWAIPHIDWDDELRKFTFAVVE